MAFEGYKEVFPEFSQKREDLLARARKISWYHTLTLDDTLTTKGIFSLDDFIPYYLLPESLSGLSCLEVGTGNGYWAFHLERKGARTVTATDIGLYGNTDLGIRPGQPKPSGDDSWDVDPAYGEQFRIAAVLYDSKVNYRICSVYDLSPENIGTHDVIFCGSVLMHLFGPYLALQKMARVCQRAMFTVARTEIERDGQSAARYVGREFQHVHFLLSPDCLIGMMESCGFEKVVRGPTFYLIPRDRRKHRQEICHTSVIGLKDAGNPGVDLPAPRLCAAADRLTDIKIMNAPKKVYPNQDFDMIVRFRNASAAAWRGEGKPTAFRVAYEMEISGKRRKLTSGPCRTFHETGSIFPEYLPAGLDSLVRLTVRAPGEPGNIKIKPVLLQKSNRFSSNEAFAEVAVR